MRIQSIIQIIALVGLLIWGIQTVSAVGEKAESSLKFSVPPLNPDYISSVQLQETGSEEYATGFVPPPVSFDHLTGKGMQDAVAMDTYPAKYDLRTENKLTPIRNQDIWGTCWSFAALGSLESNLKPGQTFDLSEKNMVNRNLWLTGPDTGGNYIKSGGYLLGWLGAVDESTDPYPTGAWNFSSPTGPVTAHVQNILWIPPMANATDLSNIKSAIITYGAMQSSFNWTSSNYNSSSRGYYCPTCNSSNHAINLVGWDDGYSRFNFTSPAPGDGAFLFRNSWGMGWGDQGYGWMSYYEPTIGKYNAEFLGSDLNTYSGIYQYDPAGMSSNVGGGSSNLWGGNIFNVSSNATLSAVGFYTNDIPATYDVRIYKNPSAGGPVGSTIISQKTGTVPMSGYHTIPLDTPVNLWAGEQFSIVLHITNPSYVNPLAIEYPPNGPIGNTWNASPGQGYVSSNGNSWTDLVTIPGFINTSLCIKGYTTTQVPLTHAIYASADSGGMITPSGNLTVSHGTNQTFACSANTGYQLQNLSIDGMLQNPASSYTFTNVTANHSIRVLTTRTGTNLTAGFANSATIGILPLNVTFTDTSTGGPTSWNWNFGDMTQNLTTRNPAHIYNTSGAYLVTLTIGNSSTNQTSSIQRNLTIMGKTQINASFIATPMSGTAPLAVNFTDTSTGDDITGRIWNFGDGQTGTTSVITHTFTNPGTYLVNLMVTSLWQNGTTQKTIQVSGTPSTDYRINATATIGGTIAPAGITMVPAGGTQSYTVSPAEGYGIYSVSVDGINQGSLVAYTFSNVLANHTINAGFRVITPPPGKRTIIAKSDTGSTIQPSGIIEVPEGGQQIFSIWPAANYQLNTVSVDGMSQGPIRSYLFTNVTTDHTISASSAAVGLIAGFIGAPTSGKPPLTVNFTDTSLGGPSTWFWRFGDGAFSTDQNPIHTYTRNGVYTVSLSIKNGFGSTIKTERNYITLSDQNWTIHATAGTGGSISPSGNLTYSEGASQTFTVIPSGGYKIQDLQVDGAYQKPLSSWAFNNIRQNHIISARFSPLGGYAPEITGINPDHGQQGTVRRDIIITGANIEDQASVSLFLEGHKNLTSEIVKTGQGFLVKELNLMSASLGVYDVQVMNPGGLTGVLLKSFTVTAPEPKAPVVISINPISADTRAVIPVFTITGHNFGGSDKVDFISGGISALSLPAVFTGADLAIHNLSVAPLYPGTFDIMVTNTTTGLKGTKEQAFSVRGNLSESYVINATANEYANIKPSGLISVKTGETIEFILQSKAGTRLSDIMVDSRLVPLPSNNRFSFNGVAANHTIHLDGTLASGVIMAGFRANATNGLSPLTVQFTDTSSGSPTQWSWNFGDGQMSTLQNPVHIYSRAGSFTVSLYARNDLSNNMKREKNFIKVITILNVTTTPENSSGNSLDLPTGSLQLSDSTVSGREVLVPTFPF